MSNEQQQPSDRAIAQAFRELHAQQNASLAYEHPDSGAVFSRDLFRRAAEIDAAEPPPEPMVSIVGTPHGTGVRWHVPLPTMEDGASIDLYAHPAPAAPPDGFVLVPREPTPAMWTAGGNIIRGHEREFMKGVLPRSMSASDAAVVSYRAMLAVAPKPQETHAAAAASAIPNGWKITRSQLFDGYCIDSVNSSTLIQRDNNLYPFFEALVSAEEQRHG